MTRKSPVRHKVKSHTRKGKRVDSFLRGSGKPPKIQTKRRIRKIDKHPLSREEQRYEKLLDKQAKIRYEYEQGIWSKDGRDVELAKVQKKIDELTGEPIKKINVGDRVIVSKIGEEHGVELGRHDSGRVTKILDSGDYRVEYVDKGGYVKKIPLLKEFVEKEME